MSNQPNHIYLVMDAGSPVAAFTIKPGRRNRRPPRAALPTTEQSTVR
jgi:hypothetical protein